MTPLSNPDPGGRRLPPSPPPKLRLARTLIIWLLIVAGLVVVVSRGSRSSLPEKIPYSAFKEAVRADRVEEVVIQGQQLRGSFRLENEEGSSAAERQTHFQTTLPPVDDPDLLSLLETHGVEVTAQEDSGLGQWLLYLVPFLLLIAFFLLSGRLMGRAMGQMGGRMAGFPSSRAKRYEKTLSSTTFDDVAGLDNAKTELREIVEYLKHPLRFQRLGAEVPSGVLLMGPPGTGKTLLARATAGEADVPFFTISGSEFVELFVGVGASRVRDMFATAKKEAPAILFIDEIDSVGRARGTGLGGGHDEREQTLNQILAEMDGFSSSESVVVMAATNRPDVLDPALLRPGRFDRKIHLDLPQRASRRRILDIHFRKVPLADGVDLESLAAGTVGFSGADLKNLVNEAALLAAREGDERVTQGHLEKARDRILLGSEREDLITETEQRLVAYHEAGHALVALTLPYCDPVRKITIIPRGRALGATEQMPLEDRHSVTQSYLESRLGVMLGGRAAEKVVFGEVSSAAEDDLEQATHLARRMVCRWGMSERVGAVSFKQAEQDVFLGREIAQPKDYSEETSRIIDEEVARVLRDLEQRAQETLEQRREDLDKLAKTLLERETLSARDIEKLLGSPDTNQDPERVAHSGG